MAIGRSRSRIPEENPCEENSFSPLFLGGFIVSVYIHLNNFLVFFFLDFEKGMKCILHKSYF